MRTLLILLFGLILNSPISAVFSEDPEDDYPVIVESFVANHKVYFQEWPKKYKDFLGAACMSLVRSEALSKDVIDQDAYFVMDDLIGKHMQILTYVKTGPQYITEKNYHFFKKWAPKKCYLLTDSSLLPICFFDAVNRGPICIFHSEKMKKFIRIPETYDELLKKISNKFPDEVDDILLTSDFATDFIDKSNYFGLYFKAALTNAWIKCNAQISYERVGIVGSEKPEERGCSASSSSDRW